MRSELIERIFRDKGTEEGFQEIKTSGKRQKCSL
ncbi:hypothetical protein PO124_31995 [Bacillus licheniformis]|nr:hypothetical protein [Bacillus licheniformis]